EPFERASPEKGELEREPRVRVLQIRAGELCDPAQPLPHRVAMQIEIARHRVQAAVETKVGIERAHEVGVLLAVGEWTEGAVGELANIALGSSQDERVRPEVLEHRDRAVAAHCAPDNDGLLRLKKREMRAGGPALRTADAGRERL